MGYQNGKKHCLFGFLKFLIVHAVILMINSKVGATFQEYEAMTNVKKNIFILFCLFSTFFLFGFSDADNDGGKIKKIITQLGEELASDPNIPGLSIAVLKKGENNPICVAFGTACIENNVPMTTEKKIKIGSVTKVFTASLIHRLIEKGKIEYDTTIDHFFPKFPNGNTIKISHLLNHTSGIVDMLSLEAVNTNMTKNWSSEELIGMAGAKPLIFQPGTDQRYSNTGYLMLAVISELVSGKNYDVQIQEILCKELGIKALNTGTDNAIVPQLSCGYTYSADTGLGLPMMASISIAKGTGNLESSPKDVVRLVNLDKILNNNVFDTLLLTPLKLANGKTTQFTEKKGDWEWTSSYLDGCTLFIFKEPAITLVGKLGSFPGFGTAYLYDQKTKIAVAVSLNNEKYMLQAMILGMKILHKLRS